MRSLAGVSSGNRTVLPRYPSRAPPPFQLNSHPPSLRAPSRHKFTPSYLTMRLSKMSSVSRQPLVYHLTGHGTVLSTCCLGPSYPRVEYNLCPSWSARLWMITSRRLDVKYSCGLQLLLGGQEGWGLEALHRLHYSKFPNSEAAVPTSPGPSCPWGTPWSLHILQVGPAERI